MSNGWEADTLLEPIAADRPCGEDLEDTHLLSSFDTYRLFGRSMPFDASEEDARSRIGQPDLAPDWGDLKDKSLDALRRSKDLRLLVHFGAATLRTDGLAAFCATLDAAATWLERWWVETYPVVDEDALLRRNALNSLADRIAVVDALQRWPIVQSRQHGTFGLRELEAAAGPATGGGREPDMDPLAVQAAWAAQPLDGLTATHTAVRLGVAAVRRITTAMREHAGIEAVPDLDPLASVLARMDRVLASQVALRSPGAAGEDGPAGGGPIPGGGERPPVGVAVAAGTGAVASRDDAIRAMERVIEFFRRHEPSSPVPLLLERAKRLVAKDFLEVLADVAPDAVAQARSAGGLPPAE